MKKKFAEIFATKTQEEWTRIFSSNLYSMFPYATLIAHELIASPVAGRAGCMCGTCANNG